jgi:hypothetical protein
MHECCWWEFGTVDWVSPWCSFWSNGKSKEVLVEPCEEGERTFCFYMKIGWLVEVGGVNPRVEFF